MKFLLQRSYTYGSWCRYSYSCTSSLKALLDRQQKDYAWYGQYLANKYMVYSSHIRTSEKLQASLGPEFCLTTKFLRSIQRLKGT